MKFEIEHAQIGLGAVSSTTGGTCKLMTNVHTRRVQPTRGLLNPWQNRSWPANRLPQNMQNIYEYIIIYRICTARKLLDQCGIRSLTWKFGQ